MGQEKREMVLIVSGKLPEMCKPWNFLRNLRDHPDCFLHFHFISEGIEAYAGSGFPKAMQLLATAKTGM